MKTRLWIAVLLYPVVNAVLFGLGVISLLSFKSLADHLTILMPSMVVISFILAAPIAWFVAPRLRLRSRRADTALPHSQHRIPG